MESNQMLPQCLRRLPKKILEIKEQKRQKRFQNPIRKLVKTVELLICL